MLSTRLLFLLASFCSLFLDIARYACKRSNKKLLDIKQKYRPNHNNGLGGNSNRLHIKTPRRTYPEEPCRMA